MLARLAATLKAPQTVNNRGERRSEPKNPEGVPAGGMRGRSIKGPSQANAHQARRTRVLGDTTRPVAGPAAKLMRSRTVAGGPGEPYSRPCTSAGLGRE